MKRLSKILLAAVLALPLAGGLVSCDSDTVWSPLPPAGWNTFYDSRLNGAWRLVQANGRDVTGYAVNYLEFYGNGRGRYYYYSNGVRQWEKMAYWCQDSNNGVSYFQMNLQYEFSSPSTVNYWLADGGNTLWMQWQSTAGIMTYVYRASAAPGW